MRVLPAGERAVLVEVADAPAAHALAAHLRAVGAALVEDVVPGARTVLAVARDARDLERVRALVADVPPPAAHRVSAPPVTIAVDYDGEDLAAVAETTGLSPQEVVRRHTAGEYEVEFIGFAPGFAYLTGLDPALHVPRLDQPRAAVPAGSVAIAGRYAAVYPRASPGGWRLLGRTDTVLFDLDADPPSPWQAGTRVRFVPR